MVTQAAILIFRIIPANLSIFVISNSTQPLNLFTIEKAQGLNADY